MPIRDDDELSFREDTATTYRNGTFYKRDRAEREETQAPYRNGSYSKRDLMSSKSDKEEKKTPEPSEISKQSLKEKKLKDSAKIVIKFIVSNLGLLIILIGYASTGAWMFQVLEQENELTNCYEGKSTEASNMVSLKTQLISYIKNNISLSAADTSKDNETVANANIEQYLQDFRDQVLNVKGSYYYTGQDCQVDSSVWNFPNALLFTITIVTTIGYGQISPKTTKGQIVCICYATIGIPIFLMCCSNISSIFSRMFRFGYSRICCGICYLRNKKKEKQAKLAREEEKRQHNIENNSGDKQINGNSAQVVDEPEEEEEEEEEKVSVPLTITIIVIGMYIFAGAYLFKYFEDWNMITAAYFCYITLSTIGFGDYVPGQNISDPKRNTNLIFGAIYIFFGLAILAMCFDLMQEEIIAKFTWVGTKLGIVNKEVEEQEEEQEQQEETNEKVQENIQKDEKNFKESKTDLNNQYEKSFTKSKTFQRQTQSRID